MSITRKSELVEIEVTLVHRTDRAVLINDGGNANIWLPLSQIDIELHPSCDFWMLTLPEALAIEKELI